MKNWTKSSAKARHLATLLLFCALHSHAFAAGSVPAAAEMQDPDSASLVESNRPKEHVAGVVWAREKVKVVPKVDGNLSVPIATVRGSFKVADWILLRGETPIELAPDTGEFSLDVPLTGEATPVKLFAIGPFGEVEEEKLAIIYKAWGSFGQKAKEIVYPKTNMTLGLGYSSLQYSQTGVPNLTESALTLKLGYQNELFPPRWDWGISGFITALPLTSTIPGVQARFAGFSARVGYVLPQISEPWRVVIMGGAYYTTMMVSGASFGYTNVAGPMLFPVIRRLLSGGDSIGAYFKLSPVSDGLEVLSLANREIAVGASWVHRFAALSQPVSFTLDYANLDLLLSSVRVKNQSFSAGIGFAW